MDNIDETVVSLAEINVDNTEGNTVNFAMDYVQYGDNDDYPRLLNMLAKNAPLHGSLIKSIARMIAGKGISSTSNSVGEVTDIKNSRGEGIYYILTEACEEVKKNNYCYLEIIKNKKIINVLPARYVRNKVHSISSKPSEFLVQNMDVTYSDDDIFNATDAHTLKAFDGNRNHSILYIRMPDTTTVSYSAPDYEGAIDDILLDMSARNHKRNSVANGFLPSALVNFRNGVPNKEKRKKIEDAFVKKYTGSNGKARIVFSWNEMGTDNSTTIDQFEPPNLVEFFKDLTPEVQQSILNAHRVTSPLIFGVRSSQGGLGSNKDEMIQAYDIFSETVLKPYQKIMSKALSQAFNAIGIQGEFKIDPMVPKALDTEQNKEPNNKTSTFDRVIKGIKGGGPKDKNPINEVDKAKAQEQTKETNLTKLTMLDRIVNLIKSI